jgi:nuclease S1
VIVRSICVAVLALMGFCGHAGAWGPEGHSIVAEIAQRRLSPPAAAAVARLLGQTSLASMASWADDIRASNKKTTRWHFADIPIAANTFDRGRDCKPDPEEGDCIVAELERLKNDLRCAADDQGRREALQFAVHFLGDVHQPLHTVLEQQGGNKVDVAVYMRGVTGARGKLIPEYDNLHAMWDEGLIRKMTFAWGSLVAKLEDGWLKGAEATTPGIDGGTATTWADETHKVAQTVWALTPPNRMLDDDYLAKAAPIIERQLGVAGVRLARFLNEAYGSNQCPVP